MRSTPTRRRRRRARRRRAGRAEASHASRSNPDFGGSASTPGPNWSTRSSLICSSVQPAAMCCRMSCFIRCATGAFDWSSVVSHVGQTSSASRSAGLGAAASGDAATRTDRRNERSPRAGSRLGAERERDAALEGVAVAARCRRRPRCAHPRACPSGRRRTSRGSPARPTSRPSSPCRRTRRGYVSPNRRRSRGHPAGSR